MAADAASAAVPDPHDTTGNARPSGAQPGLLASALAPVAPARTAAFTLDPAAANSADGTIAGASSDAFHTSQDTPDAGAKTGTAGGGAARNQSVVKAWLLAGAERWKKGAGANIKRLEVAKARAMAQQVKETRQVSERRVTNPTPAGGGKGPGTGPSAAGKHDKGGKGQKSGSVNGPKNSGGTSRSSGGQGGPSPKGAGTDRRRDNRGKDSGVNAPGSGPAKGSDKPSKAGASDGTRAPRDGKAPGSGDTKADSRKGDRSSERKGTGPTAAAGAKGSDGKPGKDAGPAPTPKATTAPKPDLAKTDPAKPSTGKPDSDTSGRPKDQPGTPQGATPKPAEKDKPPKTPKDINGQTKTVDKTTPPTAGGKPFTTRESRETGYRDGTRAARTVAQVKAYRDGARDGWTDTLELADRQKQRLDQAHEQRKTERAQQKEQQVPATSADYHQPQDQAGPQPIPVTGINATHLTLGDGAARDTMTRGEVRTLKHFERSLADKATLADKAAEQTRLLKAHADAQAAKALQLLELARGVKGGDKLSAALTKAHEAAATQAGQAEEVHRRATRAAESCRTVLINTQTRYGAMYQAVVDSPETTPAEMTFYRGDRNG